MTRLSNILTAATPSILVASIFGFLVVACHGG